MYSSEETYDEPRENQITFNHFKEIKTIDKASIEYL